MDGEGFDFTANLDVLRELSPATAVTMYNPETGAIYTEEEAIAYIEAYCNANLSRLLSIDEGAYSHSAEMRMNKLQKMLEKRMEKILSYREKGKRANKEIEEVERVAKVLREFIRVFCRAYITFAPTPARKTEFPYSLGTYVRSSIMYFTNDEQSRQRALKAALSKTTVPKNKDEFIFGQPYVLEQLEKSTLFSDKGNLEWRIKRVLGGISVENIASKEWQGTDYYYGWSNVESEGWHTKNGRKAPYSPFQNALKAAKNVMRVSKSRSTVNVVLHDDWRQHVDLESYKKGFEYLKGNAL